MAHNLNFKASGQAAMVYQGEAPWHRLGSVIPADRVRDRQFVMELAGMDWTVAKEPIYLTDNVIIPDRVAIVRQDTKAVLGLATDKIKVIQNHEAFALFDRLLERGQIEIETAGVLGAGERVWCLFKHSAATAEPIKGDRVQGYLFAIFGHDAETSLQGMFTATRAVCENTVQIALGNKGRVFSIPHVGNVARELALAERLLDTATAAMEKAGETFASMARRAMSPAEVVSFIESVFPAADDGSISTQLATRRDHVAELMISGRGADLAKSETDGRPNAWSCLNAVTEYVDHVSTGTAAAGSATRRANQSALFGSGNEFKLTALSKARELVAV